LDEWFLKRQPKDDAEADAAFVPEPDANEVNSQLAADDPANALAANQRIDSTAGPIDDETPNRLTRLGSWLGVAAIGSALLCLVTFGFYQRFHVGAAKQENIRLVVLPFAILPLSMAARREVVPRPR
jgi:hypothetical protein